MDTYIYLLLCLSLVLPLVGILLYRKDLAPKAMKLGLFGGVAGLLAELIYFRDYWRPPSLAGIATISIEDFLFGFAITALSFLIFPVVFARTFGSVVYLTQKKLYIVFFLASTAALIFLSVHLRLNSIFVTSVIFIILSVVMLLLRPDLMLPAIVSVAILISFIVVVYVVLFNIVSPTFWDKYWLLANTRWGVTILGNIPLTEIVWYFSWVVFASISYPFASGKTLVRNVKG